MAAIQLPAAVTANLNEEQKAIMEKLIEMVKDEATSEDTKKQGLVRTPCFVVNNHKAENTKMRLIYSKSWVGDFSSDYPPPQILEWNDYDPRRRFDHEGQNGSAGGFVYADGDADDTTARKWTVAFDRMQTKVYAEAGPMGPVDWNAVKFKLDNQSGPFSKHEDPVFKGVAIAFYDGLNLYAAFEN
ncbi:uncharacterized protein LOC141599419 [Silene latifolia]|uniref:uncharacterized protein LOC141599419 n=1 Tax=Silene latifolia TaxID=37657 RepID=UPI003D782C7E